MSQVHGKTKIELYNPNTKIKKITESENVFQGQYIARYLNSAGAASNSLPYEKARRELWKTTLGGILLCRDTIPVGTEYLPASNCMVGNGAFEIVNNGQPNTLGSYNSSESSQNADCSTVTQVYDFSTQQANGEIGCICLTSEAGGYIGYGNANNLIQSSSPITWWRDRSYSVATLSGETDYVVYNDGIIYSFSYNYSTKILTMYKKHTWIRTVNLKALGPSTTTTINVVNDLGLNDSEWNSQGVNVCCSDGKIYLWCQGKYRVQPNETFDFLVYDIATNIFSVKTMTNNTTNDFYYPNGGSACGGFAHGLVSIMAKNFSTSYTIGVYFLDIDTGNIVHFFSPEDVWGETSSDSTNYFIIRDGFTNDDIFISTSKAVNLSNKKKPYQKR